MTGSIDAQALLELERQFWERAGDAAFYRERLADNAVMVFPHPFGLMDREATIAAVESSAGWQQVEFEEPRLVELAGGSAAIAYRVSAVRAGGSQYSAYASSIYVEHDGEWKLALHQQTPIEDGAA